VKYLLFATLISFSLSAKKRQYDERGNVISEEIRPNLPTPVDGAEPTVSAGQNSSLPSPVNAPATAEGDNEEALALANTANPLTKVYFENAQIYLRSERVDKALENLKKSIEAGEDEFSREAKLQSLWLRGRRGDTNLEAEVESFDEKSRSAALLRVADGYYDCSRRLLKKTECAAEAERIYAFVGELKPRSTEGLLARVRLGLLLVDAGRFEAALPHLTQTLQSENLASANSSSKSVPFDRAWYNLGQLYERPWYHHDTHKALVAYKQLLKYPQSPYHSAARERIAALEKYGIGYARP